MKIPRLVNDGTRRFEARRKRAFTVSVWRWVRAEIGKKPNSIWGSELKAAWEAEIGSRKISGAVAFSP